MYAWLKSLVSSITGSSTTPTPTDTVEAPGESDDAAGATPGEALADRVEEPHQPTTPDNPLEVVEIDED